MKKLSRQKIQQVRFSSKLLVNNPKMLQLSKVMNLLLKWKMKLRMIPLKLQLKSVNTKEIWTLNNFRETSKENKDVKKRSDSSSSPIKIVL